MITRKEYRFIEDVEAEDLEELYAQQAANTCKDLIDMLDLYMAKGSDDAEFTSAMITMISSFTNASALRYAQLRKDFKATIFTEDNSNDEDIDMGRKH